MSTPNELADWQDHLESGFAGDGQQPMQVRVYQQTRSTQDVAKTFAPHKTLIITDQQTAGRGRLGRSWTSSPGASVLMSIVWPSSTNGLTHDRVSVLSGLAVACGVEQMLPGEEVRLKWPNDVMIDGRKLAGILIEAVPGAFVIGIGLNVTRASISDPTIASRSTCLEQYRGSIDRRVVIERIVESLAHALEPDHHTEMLNQWQRLAALGQTHTFEQAGQRITGEVMDLNPDHGLIVRRNTGEIVTLPAATTSVVK